MVILHSMKRPILVRPLSDAERETLEAGLRPQRMPSPCVVARCCSPAATARTPTRSREFGRNPHGVLDERKGRSPGREGTRTLCSAIIRTCASVADVIIHHV